MQQKNQQKYIGFNLDDEKQLTAFLFLKAIGKSHGCQGEFISTLINEYLNCLNVNIHTITKENAKVIAAMVHDIYIVTDRTSEEIIEVIEESSSSKSPNVIEQPQNDINELIEKQVDEKFNDNFDKKINDTVKTQMIELLNNVINLVNGQTVSLKTSSTILSVTENSVTPNTSLVNNTNFDKEDNLSDEVVFEDCEKEKIKAFLGLY